MTFPRRTIIAWFSGHAVSQANDGDTLDIAAGVYLEPGLVIDKELTIQGAGVVVR